MEGTVRTRSRLTLGSSSRISDPKPVRNLSVKDQTNSSITLGWTKPDGTVSQPYLYGIQWEGTGAVGNKSTTNTSVLVDGLQPGSLYKFAVWVELNGNSSSSETCNGSTGERQPPLLFLVGGQVCLES